MAAAPLAVSRLLGTARTSDLYDVIAAALTILDERGDLVIRQGCISFEHADISRDGDDKYVATYYAEACAASAELERGDQEGEVV